MPLVIHLGLRQDEAPAVYSQLQRLVPGIEPTTAYDQWEGWGWDNVAQQDLPELVFHVTIETNMPMVLLNLIVTRFETFLVPRKEDGAKIIVTDKDDFESEYVEFRYPEVV